MIDVLKNNQGSTVIILTMLFLLPALLLSFFLVDARLLQVKRDMADDVIVAAGLAALANPLEEEISYGYYDLNMGQARIIFEAHLINGLKLTADGHRFWPQEGSIAVGEVSIEEFTVFNQSEINQGLTCPQGTPIQSTTIHVVVSFPVARSALVGLFGQEATIRIHRDVDNYYTLLN